MFFDKKKIKKILVIRMDRLGDLVLSLPAFASLRKNFPKAKIVALVNKPFGEMLLAHGFANETIEFDSAKYKTIKKKLLFLLKLRKQHFDFAVDLQHAKNDFAAFALLFCCAETKVGYAIGLRRLTARKAIGLSPEILSEKRHALALLEILGLKTTSKAKFKKNKKAEKTITNFLKKNNALKQKIVCLHAGVSGDIPEKAWPKERFAELAEKISKELNAIVFLTGTKKEDSLLDFIVEKSKSLAVKANFFSLNETIELLKKSDLVITNNTGPMHLSLMLEKPTIVLNAFSNPKRWPVEGKNSVLLVKKVYCWPCETGKTISCKKSFECIRGIAVQQVFETAKKVLGCQK
jgi:ADP-heptose:LPS heptosyltransferase